MATKKPVKRIKLTDGKAVVQEEVVPNTHSSQTKNSSKKESAKRNFKRPAAKGLLLPVTGPIGYVKGSWQELRQVRWPNRRSTWSLTLAVIVFTMFFVVVILILDAAFQYLFKEVLLK